VENPRLSLTTGHPASPLWPRLAERLPGATEIEMLASFVQVSGLDVIREAVFSAIAAGARIRLLVGAFDDLWQQATPLDSNVVARYATSVTNNEEIGAWHRFSGILRAHPGSASGCVIRAASRFCSYRQ